ncbi:MAG: GNAT family N-acetyltransferase [Terracidiphilus sp.]|jgi:GNAT superfamily N-acetyltransferase
MHAEDQSGIGTVSGPHVVPASSSHVNGIVEVHLNAFEGFFLQSMGERFLKELYRGFMVEPSGICLAAIDENKVVGFVAGTTEPQKFFRRLLRKRWPAFVFSGAAALARHPLRVGMKFLSALFYRGESPPDLPNATLLSSIGVAPGGKGKGIGKLLMSAFCAEAEACGASTVFLATDRDGNDAVNQFYLSNGFTLHSTYLKGKSRQMNLYTRSLPGSLQVN